MNFLKFSAAVLAVTCIASCNEKMITETPEGAGYITVTSQIGAQTKAGYETKTLPAEFIMDINQGSASFNYTKLKMSKDASSNEYTADKEELKWVSSDHKGALVKAMTIPSGVATIDDDDIVNINLLSDQTTLDNFTKNDILGARNSEGGGITIKGDAINVSFQHLMSKLHVIYEPASTSVKVSAITLKNVCLGGAYSYADINKVGSLDDRGNIKMYINTAAPDYSVFAAEAIFFPFEGKPTLDVTTNAGTKTYEIVSQNFNFMPGKRYVLKITIDANGNVAKSNISTENDWVKNVPGGKILWVGTSIPAGSGVNNYPQMVANATGLEIINNSVGGSVVLKAEPVWISAFDASSWNYLYAGGLSQTIAEARANYASKLTSLFGEADGNAWLSIIESLSYESLIIPYIDGTKDNCQTIIIDHGYNDIPRMLYEAGAFNGMFTEPAGGYAHAYFEKLINGTDPEITYDHYKLHLQVNCWDKGVKPYKEDSYLLAMEHIINKCREKNPDINIIIGNYFAKNTTWIHFAHYGGGLLEYQLTSAFCNYNRAVASLFDCLDIVNVYEHDIVSENDLWSGTGTYSDPTNKVGFTADYDASKFCPDGLHPSSDVTGKSNRAIADVYLQELSEIFGNSTKTKSSTNAYDYGWEDVELL